MPRSSKPNPHSNTTDNSHDSLSTIPLKSSTLPSLHHTADHPFLKRDPSTSSPSSPQTTLFSRDSEPPTSAEMEGGKKGKGISRSSPSGSSSQGDMADTEMEAGSSQPTEDQQPQPPPKKKRTRTLTTPQQAAVLHALLAQSRFPTTAMREEVGRSIGLSARKVQNQRQKARRPKGQNAPPLTRPPQYGPYTNVPLGTVAESSSAASTSVHAISRVEQGAIPGPGSDMRSFNPPLSATSSTGGEFYAQQELYLSEGHRRRSSVSQLSGPGVPGSSASLPGYGADLYAPPRLAEYPAPPTSSYEHVASRPSTSREQVEPPFPPRPGELHHRRRQSGGDFPITLPPLRLPRSSSPGAQSAPIQSSSAGYPPARSGALSSAPAVLPPGASGESTLTQQTPPYIPPPFTLEPQPLWDDPAFSPFNRPHMSAYDQIPSPTHYHHPTASMHPSLHLPSLSNLRLQEATTDPQITLPPIRSRADTIRPSSNTTHGPPAPSSYSRSYDRDPSGHHE